MQKKNFPKKKIKKDIYSLSRSIPILPAILASNTVTTTATIVTMTAYINNHVTAPPAV